MTAIINGSSPSITFSDGTTQATSAIVSGYVPYANLPAGSVLQVVQGSLNTSTTSTTSGTFVTTGITASITPKFSTSKVLVFVNTSLDNNNASYQVVATIYRNSTNVIDSGSTSGSGFNGLYNAGSRNQLSASYFYLDSPATTSSTTYTLYARSIGGGNVTVNNSCSSYVTLMEIAA